MNFKIMAGTIINFILASALIMSIIHLMFGNKIVNESEIIKFNKKKTKLIYLTIGLISLGILGFILGLPSETNNSSKESSNSSNSFNVPAGVSSACYCMDALSGGKIYNSSANYNKCKKMFICWDNAQADCMFGTSRVWNECIGN